MGDGGGSRVIAARAYALVGGSLLIILGLVGMLAGGAFGSSAGIEAEVIAGVSVNGWWSSILILVGLLGLLLATRAPLLFCSVSALVFGLLALAGFFGSHGGESIPNVLNRVPVATGNSVFALLTALAALAPFALPRHGRPGDSLQSLGRPRRADNRRTARRTIN